MPRVGPARPAELRTDRGRCARSWVPAYTERDLRLGNTALVKLLSDDGSKFEIRPVSYQFAANPQAQPGTDWDANWLVVRGDVMAADGLEWTFVDPCLTTWEARQLATWLRAIIDGTARPTAEWSDRTDLLTFTEPNIAFSLQEHTDERARIRVHLSLEALPPHLHGPGRPDTFAYYLTVDTSVQAIAAAADEWNDDCRSFPVR